VAGEAEARELVVIKPAGATGHLVDPYFTRCVPPAVRVIVVPADQAQTVLSQLADGGAATAS
jgi:hypothetical protein